MMLHLFENVRPGNDRQLRIPAECMFAIVHRAVNVIGIRMGEVVQAEPKSVLVVYEVSSIHLWTFRCNSQHSSVSM